MNIFVGNLSFDTTEADLKQLFETMGEVSSAVIVMEKEKKAPKSRGFGFVEMPDDSQALTAISTLNGRDFMGRLLNVNPTHPKTETQRQSELEKRAQLKAKSKMRAQADEYQPQNREEKEPEAVRPFVPKPFTYKGGRRSRSYALRTGGVVDMNKGTKPWQKRQQNPMRWRSSPDQPKPWQRSASGSKPWEKTEGASQEARPWKRPEATGPKVWQKYAGGAKPWQRSSKGHKPWEKTEGVSQETKPWKRPERSASKPWQKPAGVAKPWIKKSEGGAEARPWKRAGVEAKPWKKAEGSSKPWVKRERPQVSRFKTPRKISKDNS